MIVTDFGNRLASIRGAFSPEDGFPLEPFAGEDELTFSDGHFATVFHVATLKGNVTTLFQTDALQFQFVRVALGENDRPE